MGRRTGVTTGGLCVAGDRCVVVVEVVVLACPVTLEIPTLAQRVRVRDGLSGWVRQPGKILVTDNM